jgi:hypothetical protein
MEVEYDYRGTFIYMYESVMTNPLNVHKKRDVFNPKLNWNQERLKDNQMVTQKLNLLCFAYTLLCFQSLNQQIFLKTLPCKKYSVDTKCVLQLVTGISYLQSWLFRRQRSGGLRFEVSTGQIVCEILSWKNSSQKNGWWAA